MGNLIFKLSFFPGKVIVGFVLSLEVLCLAIFHLLFKLDRLILKQHSLVFHLFLQLLNSLLVVRDLHFLSLVGLHDHLGMLLDDVKAVRALFNF